MEKRLVFFMILLVTFLVSAQKNTREIIDAHNIHTIRINTDEVYLIRIISTNSSRIKINTHSEGEYYDEIIVETFLENDELKITTKYPQILTGGFDKLSTHKMFSLEIELEIPEDREVIISSNIASIKAMGRYRSLYADLKQGYCNLSEFSGNAVINTYTGDIIVETFSGLIEASSRNGRVELPDFLPGRNPLRLTSIDGDIIVRKN